ncbi:MAG: hypothetical protein IT168_33190 [Bryobacterales bacterium]|nr:hypothetical protein [Bryobacterales bacterium]
MKQLRMEDRAGCFIRWADESELKTLTNKGAIVQGSGRRRKVVVNALVEKYDGPISIAALNGQQKTTYTERFSTAPKPVTILKYYDQKEGTFKKWDDNLTFEEARRGLMVSKVTSERERAARRMREAELAEAA